MDAIFQQMKEPEMLSPRIRLFIETRYENEFDSGLFAIVPDIPPEATRGDVNKPSMSDAKNYQIRIPNQK